MNFESRILILSNGDFDFFVSKNNDSLTQVFLPFQYVRHTNAIVEIFSHG